MHQLSFSSLSVEGRKSKSDFFDQINALLDWKAIERELRKYYTKGLSANGRPSYSGLLLFKITLLQTWYGLSDYEVEERLYDSLSFMKFTGLTLEDLVPDHSVISRFRSVLTQKKAYDKLMNHINDQLSLQGLLVKKGAIVDASITDTARQPRGKKTYEIVTDQSDCSSLVASVPAVVNVKVQSHVDTEAAWVQKGGKLRYGYKKHVATNQEGLIVSLHTTAANESDMNYLEQVVAQAQLPPGIRVLADKGYCSKKNRDGLQKNGYKDGIMHKGVRGKAIHQHQQKFNKIVSKTRYKIERTFGSIKRWFKTGIARYVGLAKTHSQHIMEAIAYNLYRAPRIPMSCSQQNL